MKYLLFLLVFYQTLATVIELPGGWIMFTRVEAYEWRFEHEQQEVDWRPFVAKNAYILNLRLVRKLANFVCTKSNLNSLEMSYRRQGQENWRTEIVNCEQ